MRDGDVLRLQEKAIVSCFMEIDRAYEGYAKSRGLSYLSLAVLEMLYDNDGECTQKGIAKELMYPKQSVNLVIKGFMDDGYVESRALESDKRNKVLSLTDKGRAWSDRILSPLRDADEAAFSRLSGAERDAYLRLSRIYAGVFSEEIGRLV